MRTYRVIPIFSDTVRIAHTNNFFNSAGPRVYSGKEGMTRILSQDSTTRFKFTVQKLEASRNGSVGAELP